MLSDDIDSRDSTDPGAAVIRRNVVSVTVGGVVSLHLGHPGTLAALPGVLDDLAGRVLRPVAASALFASEDWTCRRDPRSEAPLPPSLC